MAKKNQDDVENASENTTGAENGTTENAEETTASTKKSKKDAVEEADEAVVSEKEVRIQAVVNHKCNIGKVEYILEKGKSQRVPASVATILSASGKCYVVS